ncbi:MAG: NUDIX domain-containing protein [Flavobacteriales bacterium]|nr:NUDIX domain-containing protein [Flavobacteriales bacterium]
MIDKFNVRVYGTWIEDGKVLLTREKFRGMEMTKFPGGGVQFGEGIIDALQREFREELRTDIEILGHLYTTDFFQQSAFNPREQLISIYYRVRGLSRSRFRPPQAGEGPYEILWESIEDLLPEKLSFPIDRHVIHLLRNGR